MTDCYSNPTSPECAPPKEPEPLPPEEPGTPLVLEPPTEDLPATGIEGVETSFLGVLLLTAGIMMVYLGRKRG